MKNLKFENEHFLDILKFKENEEKNIQFIFEHVDKLKSENNLFLEGEAEDLDPAGDMEFDEFDPTGEYNPMKLYSYSDENVKLMIMIPLTEENFVGVNLKFFKNQLLANEHSQILIY